MSPDMPALRRAPPAGTRAPCDCADLRGESSGGVVRCRRPLPVALHRCEDRSRIFTAADAAVVPSERSIEVASFEVEVVTQDSAAIAQVGTQGEQIVAVVADLS